MGIKLSRKWAMPSKWTFRIPAVKEVLDAHMSAGVWADPFAGENSPASLTNDIEGRGNEYQMDGLAFLKTLTANSVDGILFDPPYSVEQCLRRYTPKRGGTAGRAEYWAKCKDEIARIVRQGGKCISFAWDSCGVGGNRKFEILEVVLICHGACHNDTIITIDYKRPAGEGEK